MNIRKWNPAQGPSADWTFPFALLMLVGFLGYTSLYLLVPVLPVHAGRLGATDAEIGTVLGVFSATALLIRPWSGWFADRFANRPVLLLGAAAMAAAGMAFIWTRSVPALLAIRLLHGVGWGLFSAAANIGATQLAPPERRGAALGVFGMAGGLALALGPVAGSALGPTPLGFGAAALAAGLALALGAAMPRTPAADPARAPGAPVRLALVSRPALLPAAIHLLHMCTYGAVFSFVPVLAERRHLGNPGWFFATYAAALFALRSVTGHLSDRYGRPQVVSPGMLLGAAGLLTLAAAGHALTLAAAAVLYAGAMAAIQPVIMAWAADRAAPGERGTAIATIISAQDLGISVGSFAAGIIAGRAGLGAVFVCSAALSLAGALAAGGVAWGRRPGRPAPRG